MTTYMTPPDGRWLIWSGMETSTKYRISALLPFAVLAAGPSSAFQVTELSGQSME